MKQFDMAEEPILKGKRKLNVNVSEVVASVSVTLFDKAGEAEIMESKQERLSAGNAFGGNGGKEETDSEKNARLIFLDKVEDAAAEYYIATH